MISPILVSIVDDDESVRESLPDLLRELGFRVRAFASAEAFLASDGVDATECLILDVALSGMSGPDLFRKLADGGRRIPTVFITAHGNEALRESLLVRGALACLSKPFSESALREALDAALSKNR